MDHFKRYPSIENTYQEKNIQKWLERFPELATCEYIVTEKIDGCNIQLLFLPDGTMKIGRRAAWLEPDEKFFDVHEGLRNQPIIEEVRESSKSFDAIYRLYGELTGPKINRRVNYDKYNAMNFFLLDVEINGSLVAPTNFNFMYTVCKYSVPPILYIAKSLSEALEYSCDFDSKVLSIENNPAEGLVIRPYHKNYWDALGNLFILKKKSEKFCEIAKVKKPRLDPSADQINFVSYINENRVLSVFSKHGNISDATQMGDYIKLIIQDAKEDFIKEYPHIDTEDRAIFKMGGNAAAILLRKYL